MFKIFIEFFVFVLVISVMLLGFLFPSLIFGSFYPVFVLLLFCFYRVVSLFVCLVVCVSSGWLRN